MFIPVYKSNPLCVMFVERMPDCIPWSQSFIVRILTVILHNRSLSGLYRYS